MTNATKANIIAFLNALLAVAVLFGLDLTEDQLAGIAVALNALGAVVVGLTYKASPKRVPDEGDLS